MAETDADRKARLEALTGYVLILYPGVFGADTEITLGPDVLDYAGNAMNQDGDTINGEPEDLFTGTRDRLRDRIRAGHPLRHVAVADDRVHHVGICRRHPHDAAFGQRDECAG